MERIKKIQAEYHSRYYREIEKHDSPDLSRTQMCKYIFNFVKNAQIPNNQILSIGSGRQALEKQLLVPKDPERKNILKDIRITTIDLADIPKSKLIGRKYKVEHVNANAENLPFKENTFGLVVSNLAIDFAPKNALSEAFRVLAPKGKVIFNFHHPLMYTKNTDNSPEEVKKFFEYIKENKTLHEDPESIKNAMIKSGFEKREISISFNTDGEDKWWTVIAHKQ